MGRKVFESHLRQVTLFSSLNSRQLNIITHRCQKRFAPKDSVILHQNDKSFDLYVVISGKVKVSLLSEDGKEIVLDVLKEGDFFGELSFFDKRPRSATVTAITDSNLLVLNRETFLKILNENPAIAINLLSVMGQRLRKTDEKIETLAFLDVYGRVARMLMNLSKEEGQRLKDGSVVIRRPTHKEIAHQIGASREAVTKAMKTLVSYQLINIRGRHIIVNPQSFRM
ncbi:MAG: Crp/Fnr family transcriptional regulator [Nitrospirae bacterium]|nr:Crp/Fnr family transcriptional regulator [Nitrospirota bacterium]